MKANKLLPILCALALFGPTICYAQDAGATTGTPKRRPAPMQTPAQLSAAPNAAGKAAPSPTLGTGVAAPDFVSKDLNGKEVRLSDWPKKIVVLDFWATWCGPCKASLPHTQEVAQRYKDKGVLVLAVCTSDARDKFEQFVKGNQAKYPDVVFACDPNERGSTTYAERASQKLYHVQGIPTQFVIGRDGKIAAVLVGYSQGERRLEEALGKLGV